MRFHEGHFCKIIFLFHPTFHPPFQGCLLGSFHQTFGLTSEYKGNRGIGLKLSLARIRKGGTGFPTRRATDRKVRSPLPSRLATQETSYAFEPFFIDVDRSSASWPSRGLVSTEQVTQQVAGVLKEGFQAISMY